MRAYTLLTMACISGIAFCGQAAAAEAGKPANAPANDPNQIVCHTTGAPTGSRIGSARECHPAKEWETRQQEHQHALTSLQMHSLTGAPR